MKRSLLTALRLEVYISSVPLISLSPHKRWNNYDEKNVLGFNNVAPSKLQTQVFEFIVVTDCKFLSLLYNSPMLVEMLIPGILKFKANFSSPGLMIRN